MPEYFLLYFHLYGWTNESTFVTDCKFFSSWNIHLEELFFLNGAPLKPTHEVSTTSTNDESFKLDGLICWILFPKILYVLISWGWLNFFFYWLLVGNNELLDDVKRHGPHDILVLHVWAKNWVMYISRPTIQGMKSPIPCIM